MSSTPPPETHQAILRVIDWLPRYNSLAQLFADKPGISQSAFYRWMAQDRRGLYREAYARAQDARADKLVDEILRISDDASNDYTVDADGNTVVDHENIQRSRLRVDSRKWLAGKMAPKRYGDRLALEVEHTLDLSDLSNLVGRIEDIAERLGVAIPTDVLRLPERDPAELAGVEDAEIVDPLPALADDPEP